jgi:hypothetical protein
LNVILVSGDAGFLRQEAGVIRSETPSIAYVSALVLAVVSKKNTHPPRRKMTND